jgi:hypothetical protein
MLKKALMIATMASVAGAAFAADKKQNWPLEPDSFMGISLTKSLAESMPQCTGKNLAITQTSLCHDKEYVPDYASIYGGPKIGVGYNLAAKTRGNRIQYISMDIGEEEFDKLLLIFTEKYGKPTSKDLEAIQTKGGAKFTNEIYNWIGKKVSIRVERYSGDIDSSSAMIFNREVLEAAARDTGKKVSDGASKL